MTSFLQDLRMAARAMVRAPGFALTAVLVVAIGVGATSTAFAAAAALLLRPVPAGEPARLVSPAW